MARKISIHQIDQDILRAELRHVIQYFRDLGHEQCELVFGWHWGMDYPAGAPWEAMLVPLSEVEAEVRIPESAGFGEMGRDEIVLRIPQVDGEFEFCHHMGIHLSCSRQGIILEHFRARWSLEFGRWTNV